MRNLSLIPTFITLFFLSALFFISVSNANDIPDKAKLFKEFMQNLPQSLGPTDDPPPQPAVNPAEWEPMTGVIIRYPLYIPISLVAEMSEDVELMTIVASEAQIQTAYNQYNNYGVNMANCTWLISGAENSPWTRDYGPWFIFTGEDEQGIIDFNAPYYPGDDPIPGILGDTLDIPVYYMPMSQVGGNYMSDGMGVAMSSDRVYDDNSGITQEEIDELLQEYLGIENYIIVPHYESFPDLRHIDTMAKMLDPGRVIIMRLDPPDPEVEAAVELLQTLMSPYGRPYEVLRIDGWGYTNSLFLNNKVLVPQLSDPLDARALETWAEAMPGYEVLGFTGNFGSHDAIHCRTMGMTDRYMLRIVHIPLHDRENNGGDYLVEARIHPYSNEPLVGSPLINWKIEGGIYNTVSMTNISGDDFIGNLPQQPDGTDIYYYLSAEDESGRQENHPFIGEGNPHHFFAGPDTIPPYVDWEMAPPSFITVENWPLALTAKVMDNLWVSSVTLEYMINGIPQDTVEMSLQPLSAVCYDGALTGEIHPYDLIQLRLKAVDTSINQNITYDPPAGYYTIDVEGSARTCVWNACGQSSGQVIYEMLERAGIQSVYTLEEPGNLNRFENMFIFLGVTPYSYVIDEDQEDAIVDYINSGHNVYLEGGDCWVWDPNHEELCQVFGIIGLDDGEELESPILGVEDTFTEGMSFDYVSTNNHIDQVEPAAGAELIFQYDDIGIGVANQTHTHSTVGLCFEFSGLAGNNPVSSQENLFRQILHYFYPTQPEVAGLGLDGVSDALPDQYSLAQNYPNPFNPVTTLNYYLPEAGEVLLTIYDIQGREAARLVDGHLSSGEHTVDWNAADFASGIYFARLDNGKVQITQKLLLIK